MSHGCCVPSPGSTLPGAMRRTQINWKWITGILMAGCLSQGLSAVPILQWGADDYGPGYQAFPTASAVEKDGFATIAYSDEKPIFTGPPKIFGAFSVGAEGASGAPTFAPERFGLDTVAHTTRLRFGVEAAGHGPVILRGLVFFKKSEFLNGTATEKVTLDDQSTFSLNIISSSGDTTLSNGRQCRMAVLALVAGEWSWYVSERRRASGEFFLENAGSEKWRRYPINPSMIPLQEPDPSTVVSGVEFEDINAVGIYINYITPVAGSAFIFATSFSVSASVIP